MSEQDKSNDTETDHSNHTGTPTYERSGKRGHKCCGCCCDVRRAVIIVDSISVVNQFIQILSLPSLVYVSSNPSEFINDDEVKEMESDNVPLQLFLVSIFVLMIAFAVGIVGAIRYNIFLIGIATLFHVMCIIVGFIYGDLADGFFGAIISASFAYPHFVLIQEIRASIMSEENYENEEHSCCCV